MSRSRMTAALLCFAAVACGCAGRPHALDYVVLKNGEQRERPPPPEVRKLEAAAEHQQEWPIYEDDEPAPAPGTGGSGCSVGLIGAECERGLLEDEPTLEEQQLLGPDGVVVEAPLDLGQPPPFRGR